MINGRVMGRQAALTIQLYRLTFNLGKKQQTEENLHTKICTVSITCIYINMHIYIVIIMFAKSGYYLKGISKT